ncbi:PREDICTED: uncharacterized protein LOC106807644 [Priapulus caudatus]|uniref:Uncharacterized protein LOC106807644 n=1 Tax=Priapulus caudatus TaxID=37621 RepID=A0ABM1E020_PRICU|nr:PREDICTED: uncharacterized protein LOC106807644 [Priapulus caudatus]
MSCHGLCAHVTRIVVTSHFMCSRTVVGPISLDTFSLLGTEVPATPPMQLCSARVVRVGANLPCHVKPSTIADINAAGTTYTNRTISGIIDMATIALGTCANVGDDSVAYTNGENNVEIKLAFKLAKDSDLGTVSKVSAVMQYSETGLWIGLMSFTTVDTYTPVSKISYSL